MEALNKFKSLPKLEKKLLLKAVFLVLLIRLVIVILPFNIITGFISNIFKSKKSLRADSCPMADRVRWAVDAGSNSIPFTKNCLVKSIAIHILLRNYNYESIIHFGVRKDSKDILKAHAWVECEGEIFSSESEIKNYTPFKTIEMKT